MKNKLEKIEIDPEEVNDSYFGEYWDQTVGKVDDFMEGIRELSDGMITLRDGLSELKKNNSNLSDGLQRYWMNHCRMRIVA